MDFLTPLAGLVALLAAVPLVALLVVAGRAQRLRAALGIGRLPARRLAVPAAATAAVALLVALAAAQPVVARVRERSVRTDAEALFVIDTSRSMLASAGPDGTTRFDRARNDALALRARIPNVRAGIVSLTDRALPHLLPVADPVLFRQTLEQAVGVERPPPVAYLSTGVTTYAALTSLVDDGFFPADVTKRLAIVLTDGESRPYNLAGVATELGRAPPLRVVFVHLWAPAERVYTNGMPEAAYKPDPASGANLARLARAAGGYAFAESQLSEAAQTVRRLVGQGPTVAARRTTDQVSIAPFLVLGTIAPLLVLVRRSER